MIVFPCSPESPMPLPGVDAPSQPVYLPEAEDSPEVVPAFGVPWEPTPFVITNSFDDDDEDSDLDEVQPEDDEDVYEEVETFEDFDDDFDEDFEDEFDEDYEDLDKLDDDEAIEREIAAEDAEAGRFEEDFGDVDGRAHFIPDGTLSEEILLPEEELSDVVPDADFSEFDDEEEEEEFNDFDD